MGHISSLKGGSSCAEMPKRPLPYVPPIPATNAETWAFYFIALQSAVFGLAGVAFLTNPAHGAVTKVFVNEWGYPEIMPVFVGIAEISVPVMNYLGGGKYLQQS